MDRKTVWKAVLGELQVSLSATSFKSWIRDLELTNLEPAGDRRQIATIMCRAAFHRETVENRYYGQIKTVLDRLTGKRNELAFAVKPPAAIAPEQVGPLFTQAIDAGRVGLRSDFTFDTWAVSPTNEMAFAAAQAVAKNPGQAYHLLFLYGGVGVGKTHLMQAVGHEVLKHDPGVKLMYCTGEEFMNQFVAALRQHTTGSFKQKFRSLKLWLVDDVQFIGGKETAQQEFFHTFNAIGQNRGQVILTADRLPAEISGLEDRLRSRFEGGLMVDIQKPDFELRTAILQIKAQAQGISLPMDAAALMAANIDSTRRLEGFLMTLGALSQARGEPITPEMVAAHLGVKTETNGEKKYVNPKEVVETVASYFNLKPAVLRGERRKKDLVWARHIAMYLLRIDLGVALTDVGEYLGRKDHTTVIHAVDKIKANLLTSENLRTDVETVRKKLYG
jgi:chromosomal replication initiator protein